MVPDRCFSPVSPLKLIPQPTWDVTESTATDGRFILYNPDYVNRLSNAQLIGVLCQNVLHCALKHITRRGFRDRTQWDIAADLSVNKSILDARLQLPPDQPIPGHGKYASFPLERSAEEYYELLSEPQDDDPGDDQTGSGSGEDGSGDDSGDSDDTQDSDPGQNPSESLDAAQDASEASTIEGEWDQNIAQAEYCAKQRGTLPGSLQRFCTEQLTAKVSWQDRLREFVTTFAKNDFSWQRPNRRFIWQDIYLPGLHSEELGTLAIAIDTSGSIGQRELDRFAAELQAILDSFNCTLKIIYHDHEVAATHEWCSTDGPLEFSAVGGGGTSHRPVFEHIDQHEPPTALLCFTDAYTEFPEHAPDYPVLWCVIDNNNPQIPFGEVLHVEL
jgi:predicted metal-dependent peptidase